MNTNLLYENEKIKKAIKDQCENPCQENIDEFIKVLQERMIEKGKLLIPVEKDEYGEESIRTISNDEGVCNMVAFTEEEEMYGGPHTEVSPCDIGVYLEKVIDNDVVEGLVINPWGQAFFMTKQLIQIILEAKEVTEDSYIRDNAVLNRAIHFATERHAGQLRKGTTTPYIVHPMETMSILANMKADTNLIIAGVLHDTLEDTDTTWEEIYEKFGTDVCSLVCAHSEDKSKTWEERKTKTIEELEKADDRLQMLVMADKLANLRSLHADYKVIGEELWERFNAPKEKQSWYYGKVQDALYRMKMYSNTANAYWEMVDIYKELFVVYYLDDSEKKIYQDNGAGEVYVLQEGTSEWIEFEGNIPEKAVVIPRNVAEILEDSWNLD